MCHSLLLNLKELAPAPMSIHNVHPLSLYGKMFRDDVTHALICSIAFGRLCYRHGIAKLANLFN